MPRTLFLIFILLLANTCFSIEFPYEIIQSRNDLYLKGNVKEMRKTVYIENNLPDPSISYKFNAKGLIENIENKGLGIQSMKLILKNDKLDKIYIFHGDYGDKNNSTVIVPIELDKIGRATKIKAMRLQRNGAIETIHPIVITTISYGKDHQEQKTYMRQGNSILLANTKIIEFDKDGYIKKLCSTWNNDSACESGNTKNFSHYGPTHYRSMPSNTTEFSYENSFLSKETSTNSQNIISSSTYYDYKIDDCGNWIERKIGSSTNYLLEIREIEYFNKCNNS